MQLVSCADVNSRCRLPGLYVGQASSVTIATYRWTCSCQWALPWLRGRTVSTQIAVAGINAGEALLGKPRADDPRWLEIHADAHLLGLSARELAAELSVDCEIPEPPRPPARISLWQPRGHW